MVVKIPAGLEGTEATHVLAKERIKVNYTLCFSVNQALLAARAGAAYVSPFVGRLDDIGEDGMLLIKDILQVYRQYPEIKTEVIAASIRHPQHCLAAAKAGSHIATSALQHAAADGQTSADGDGLRPVHGGLAESNGRC